MKRELMDLKEEAILFAKDKIEDAAEALSELLPEMADELNWFLEEMGNQLTQVRSDKLAFPDSDLYGGGIQ